MIEFTHEGLTGRYSVAGSGSEALVILPGALGAGGLLIPLLAPLAGARRLLALETFPRAARIDELLDWLGALFEAEGVSRWVIYAGSFGGLIAQCLLRRWPERTEAVILSGTGIPDPEQARKNRKFLRLLPWLPMPLLRAALRLLVRLILARVRERREEWKRAFLPLVGTLTRADVVSRYQLAIDFAESSHFAPGDLTAWPGRLLILEGSSDRVAGERVRAALRALYPQAERHAFAGSGHAAAFSAPAEWAAVVGAFLSSLQRAS